MKDEENLFWLATWRVIGAVVVGLAVTIASCDAHRTYRISEAIKAGVNPLAAKCALDRPEGSAILICAKELK